MTDQLVLSWYMDCIYELEEAFGEVDFDDERLGWVLIHKYPLPETFTATDSVLVIATPELNIDNYAAYDFFMNKGLGRKDRKQTTHLFDSQGYNPYSHLGYSRLSFHLKAFSPAFPAGRGDTLLDICQSLYHFLGQDW